MVGEVGGGELGEWVEGEERENGGERGDEGHDEDIGNGCDGGCWGGGG